MMRSPESTRTQSHCGHAFDAQVLLTHFTQLLGHLVRDGIDVPVGPPRGNNHGVGNGRLVDEI